MNDRLTDKVALISGAASGIGASHARAFVAEGAKVVIGDLAETEGRELAAELGDQAAFVRLDVTSREDWDEAVAFTLARFGRLNVLVNNAGICVQKPFHEVESSLWNTTLAVNLTGAFHGMQACVEALTAAAPSAIINTSSSAGLQGVSGLSAYSASKFGLRGLSRTAAIEFADRQIRVNTVHPGGMATAMGASMREINEESLSGNTLHRFGQPEEVTSMVVYLASDEASFVNGAEISVDGGEMAGLSF